MRTIKHYLTVAILLVCGRANAAIHGDVDAIPTEPRAFATLCFPANYQTHRTSQDLLRAFAVHPAFKELRRITHVTTYAANDPDFRHRWASRMPQVIAGRPCLVISFGDNFTPQKLIYGRDVGPGGAVSVDALAADLERRVLPNLRSRLQQRPQQPQFVHVQNLRYRNVEDFPSGPNSVPATTLTTYTYSYGRPRIRILRPRQPNCPDCVNPIGPQPHVDPTTEPVRPLLPPIDEVITYPPDSTPTDPPPAPIDDTPQPAEPNEPLIPPAPTPDPRIEEQQQQIDKQAETIKQLQQTIHQLQQTVVNVQPAKDYAPDINAIKSDVQHLQVAQAAQQKVNIIVENLKNAQADQEKINADLVASLKAVADQRNQVMVELNNIRQELAIDYDKTAQEVANRLTHSATITTLDGKTKLQTKPLNEPLEFVQRQRGIK